MSARRQKVVRGALSAASVLVIAFCAWSMSQYARGEDPLASLTAVSGPSLATTQEAAAGSGMAAGVQLDGRGPCQRRRSGGVQLGGVVVGHLLGDVGCTAGQACGGL